MSRKTVVVVGLLVVSTTMVYGTWLAADDMRAKPLVAFVAIREGYVQIQNTGSYTWQDVRLTVDGAFVCGPTLTGDSGAVPPRMILEVNLAACRNAAGATLTGSPRAAAVTVTRIPRFPRLNRARSASGTFRLE